jgi:hypothetical protein
VTVRWQPVDGAAGGKEETELYLTTAGRQRLHGDLAQWLAVGHRPGTGPVPGTVSPERDTAGNRDQRKQERAWADGLGLVNETDPRYHAWQTTTGGYYYPADLDKGFALHKEGREDEAREAVRRFMPEYPESRAG